MLGVSSNGTVIGTAKTLTTEVSHTHTAEYNNQKKVTINGIAIENFKIAVKSKDDVNAAERLVRELGKHNGFSIPVVQYSEIKDSDKGVVCFGSLDRSGKKTVVRSQGGYRVSVTTKDGYTLGLSAMGTDYYQKAVTEIFKRIKVATSGNNVNITLPTETLVDYKYTYVKSTSTKLTRDDTKTITENISDGVVYKEYYYTGENGNPYVANVIYVDTSKNSFRLGTPREEYNNIYSTRTTLTAQMQSATDKGYEVVAGINGDRWETNTETWQTWNRAMAIKDGTLISRGTMALPYFGMTKDGEYVIGENGTEAVTTQFEMVVGGDFMLVENGMPIVIEQMDDQHCYISHPRTLIGITDDGNLILVTVDGRQSHSNGLTMEMAADLMASLGAATAVSLDGGGSTTMAVKSGSSFTVKNNPSDGSQRAIINSVLIVKKES